MEILTQKNNCIITPHSPKLDKYQSDRLIREIQNNDSYNIGLNLSFVNECTIDFIDAIKNLKNISLFNVTSDIFALFTIMDVDKNVNLFVSQTDFEENKRRVLCRKLKIVTP